MNAMTNLVGVDCVDEFFAPVSSDFIDGLIGQYRQSRARIAEIAAFSESEACKGAIGYFLSGNATQDRGRISMEMSAKQLFQEDGAVASLNADYWGRALALTDVYDAMPQERRNQWNEQIRCPMGKKKGDHDVRMERNRYPDRFDEDGEYINQDDAWEIVRLPDFEDATVRSTLQSLLASRAMFLSERVDGIFRALSGEHVTNSPAAFGKRMIIARLISSYDTINHDRVGYINDLRCVIAKFMGRDEPKFYASSQVVETARRERRGEWVTLDGGALRLRAYKCGTAHLEVHPDMAWRLNKVLAYMHPMAIPPEFRTKPKKKLKDFVMMGRPLPFAVVARLAAMKREPTVIQRDRWTPAKPGYTQNKNALQFDCYHDEDKAVRSEAERVLEYIGGVKMTAHGHSWFEFDYNPDAIISEIVCSGCIPDQKAHQFYASPPAVADAAIELADIGPEDECLEPQAGQGGLADRMPKEQTTCVEISPLHCGILRAKGHKVIEADFLVWAETAWQLGRRFGCVVANPPFADGRAKAHAEAAAKLVRPGGGRLVVVLPASLREKYSLPGFTCTWSRVFANEFAGTSVSVAIMLAVKL